MLRYSEIFSTSTPFFFFSGRRRFLRNTAVSVHNFHGILSDHLFHPLNHLTSSLGDTGHRAMSEVVAGFMEDGEAEEGIGDLEFIEVGYISGVHGIKGELRVKSNTGFPEFRFCKPGRRWLRARILGKEGISGVELRSGRSHPGQKCWIVCFDGIDSVDKAKQIVGSTILVREEDRPKLEEDEFYNNDLIGMRVIHKETGNMVGRVADVFNSGANDLLHVKRYSSDGSGEKMGHSDVHLSETDATDQFLWIPFVKAIVPEVDMARREMIITPPKGLLELNLRTDMRSKKERRQMEWKLRKKLQQRITAAKRRLNEMGQSRLLDGFSIGEKDQKDMLARQIMDVNLSLFQHAVRSIGSSSARLSLFDFVGANSDLLLKNALKMPHKYLLHCVYSENNSDLLREGLRLLNNSKAAIILVFSDDRRRGMVSDEIVLDKLRELLVDYKRFIKIGENCNEIPLIMVTSSGGQTKSSEQLLLDNGYFGFNAEKVLFIEETKLPIVSKSEGYKILLKSPWEMLSAPIGSGGTFAALTSQEGIDFLREMSVEYVQICSLSGRSSFGNPLFFGWASSQKAKMAFKISPEMKEKGDDFDFIFSIEKLNEICKEMGALYFEAVAEQQDHIERGSDGEWAQIKPNSLNSYRFYCSIYGALKNCSKDEVCVMQVLE